MGSPYALDFQPIVQMNALRKQNELDWAKNALAERAAANEETRLRWEGARQPGLLALQQQQVETGADEATKRKTGLLAGFIQAQKLDDPNTPPDVLAARWEQIKTHPAFKDAGFDHPMYGKLFSDPHIGPSLITGIYRGYRDPLDTQTKQVGIEAKRAETTKDTAHAGLFKAQADAAANKDMTTREIFQALGLTPPSSAAMPPPVSAPSPIRPQSAPGPSGSIAQPQRVADDVTVTDPNFIRTQAAAPVPQQQQAPPAAAAAPKTTKEVIDGMSPTQKTALGLLMAKQDFAGAAKLIQEVGDAASKFGKEGTNELDKKQINASNHISRLRSVEQAFDPKFLQIPTRIGMAWTSLKSKFREIPESEAAALGEFAEFRRASVENMSRLLNELSGAAVSPQEYERIRNTQPDAGTGIADGDDPYTFQAKMKGVIRDQKRAIARYNYLRKDGPNAKNPWDVMGLDEIDKVINRRGAEIDQQLRQANPNASPAVLQQQRKAIMAKEFGMQI